jgi:hypothetical protein
MMTLPVTEKAFMHSVIDLARLSRWLVYHTHDSRHSTAAGYPDLCLVRGPDLLYAELKSQHGRVTPAQAQWLAALSAVQHIEATVWRPSDWDMIERRLLSRCTIVHGEFLGHDRDDAGNGGIARVP